MHAKAKTKTWRLNSLKEKGPKGLGNNPVQALKEPLRLLFPTGTRHFHLYYIRKLARFYRQPWIPQTEEPGGPHSPSSCKPVRHDLVTKQRPYTQIQSSRDVRAAHVCSTARSCLMLCDPMGCSPPGASLSMGFSRQDTRVRCHFLLQGIFLTQRWNLRLLHWQVGSFPLSYLGSPDIRAMGSKSLPALSRTMVTSHAGV